MRDLRPNESEKVVLKNEFGTITNKFVTWESANGLSLIPLQDIGDSHVIDNFNLMLILFAVGLVFALVGCYGVVAVHAVGGWASVTLGGGLLVYALCSAKVCVSIYILSDRQEPQGVYKHTWSRAHAYAFASTVREESHKIKTRKYKIKSVGARAS